MLQAMNTGHDGSLTTIHANSPRDSISRIETMVMMSGSELPSKAIRDQVASAINLIVQQARLRDGSRKVTSISEIVGMEGDVIVCRTFSLMKPKVKWTQTVNLKVLLKQQVLFLNVLKKYVKTEWV